MILSEEERAKIMHRLRIGNSPKTIALNYTGIIGIREEIEDIKAEMNGGRKHLVMRVPEGGERASVDADDRFDMAPQDGWFARLEPSIQRLILECCGHHDIRLEQFMQAKKGRAARAMVANALHFRWAMPYEQVAECLCCAILTAKSTSNAWKGKTPVTVPPIPDVPGWSIKLAALLRLTAGEYRTTERAILMGVGLRDVADAARKHLVYRLYACEGYQANEIRQWFSCEDSSVLSMARAYAKAADISNSEMEKQHKAALARRRRSSRNLIAAE
ncbi:hypothetical protein [uncultured Cohaesibacter sp.]|uniref:hypothetical protein n=1 Tax=uncultured Cohaesibacter sp. TaxID=1002546 RepID=UPI0029C73701|nr:hypothetical protein [uncultured Cohaesibacter sp.]